MRARTPGVRRGVPRVAISALRYQRARIEEADERDYAAARPGEHESARAPSRAARASHERPRSLLLACYFIIITVSLKFVI